MHTYEVACDHISKQKPLKVTIRLSFHGSTTDGRNSLALSTLSFLLHMPEIKMSMLFLSSIVLFGVTRAMPTLFSDEKTKNAYYHQKRINGNRLEASCCLAALSHQQNILNIRIAQSTARNRLLSKAFPSIVRLSVFFPYIAFNAIPAIRAFWCVFFQCAV